MAERKITQEAANYRQPGPSEARHCEHCSMFRGPSSCTLVRGYISWRGTCKHFERKRVEKYARGGAVLGHTKEERQLATAMIGNALIRSTGSRQAAADEAAERIKQRDELDHKAFWHDVEKLLRSGKDIPPIRRQFESIPDPHRVEYQRIPLRFLCRHD